MKKSIQALLLLTALVIFSMTSCRNEKQKTEEKDDAVIAKSQVDEDFRPNFHFTPKKNWMNDPNGMFYLNGTYHLYFQYYPEDNVWGPMHWG
ncbi:MAG: glycoside hydrolase family 32 protein, partial [Christiangramia sp.]